MFKTILIRLLESLVVLFLLFTATFFLVNALPGDSLTQEKALPPQVRESMRRVYGFDKPIGEQYLLTLKNYLKGDPGVSFRLLGKPVTEIVAQAFPVSTQIGVVAMAVALVIGIPSGCLAAAKKNGVIDAAAMTFAMAGICLPAFVVGPILAEIFGRKWQILPSTGWDTTNPTTWILPAVTLGLGYGASLSRLTRAGMLETLSQDFVRTARAKGVVGWKIVIKHCLRGGLIPTVAYLGPAFAGIISGSLIIETVFQIPGLGRHFIKAIDTRDRNVILALTMIYAVQVMLMNFLSDVASVWLNPRLRQNS
jgi:oligopeptide transport system permease protein